MKVKRGIVGSVSLIAHGGCPGDVSVIASSYLYTCCHDWIDFLNYIRYTSIQVDYTLDSVLPTVCPSTPFHGPNLPVVGLTACQQATNKSLLVCAQVSLRGGALLSDLWLNPSHLAGEIGSSICPPSLGEG